MSAMARTVRVGVCVLALLLAGCLENGRGEKVGTIIKVAHEGYFCPTWEATMIRGGMSDGSGSFAVAPFHFTIDNPDLLAKVKDALDKQYEVHLTYRHEFATWCRSEEGNNFVVAIEPFARATPSNVGRAR